MRDNSQQFWVLLEPLHGEVGAFCRKLARDRDEGDDLYQDAVCRALSQFDQLRDPGAFRAWLYRIIINCHCNRVTSPWWRRFERLPMEHEAVPFKDRIAERVQARLRLKIAMKPLSTRDRALVLLFETEGWSTSELAELRGISVDAVKARLSRARRKMKATLLKYLASRPGVDTKLLTGGDEICAAIKSRPR